VDVNFSSLTDAVKPANALLEEFGINRKIEQHEMMSELEISSFASDL
jgi:hypothetical protein